MKILEGYQQSRSGLIYYHPRYFDFDSLNIFTDPLSMSVSEITSNENSGLESSEPMIGSTVSPSSLMAAYAANPLPGFIPGIKYLASRYPHMRRIKGDGNCFYRSFLFSYLEQLLRCYQGESEDDQLIARRELERFHELITNSKALLINIGYEVRQISIDCLWSKLRHLLY